jgi:hypothetical protein
VVNGRLLLPFFSLSLRRFSHSSLKFAFRFLAPIARPVSLLQYIKAVYPLPPQHFNYKLVCSCHSSLRRFSAPLSKKGTLEGLRPGLGAPSSSFTIPYSLSAFDLLQSIAIILSINRKRTIQEGCSSLVFMHANIPLCALTYRHLYLVVIIRILLFSSQSSSLL